jgi:hypothetical protein
MMSVDINIRGAGGCPEADRVQETTVFFDIARHHHGNFRIGHWIILYR